MGAERQMQTYEIRHDQHRASVVNEAKDFNELLENNEQFANYTTANMETHLGERFHVILSKYEYDIKDGELWGKDMDEPFIDSIKRGREYRKENGKKIDQAREEAEVVGFEKIQKVLLDPSTEVGTMMLSISPPGLEGSTYMHNFYDVFTLKMTKSGKKYIEARRYASGVDAEEYKSLLIPFGVGEIDRQDPAASLLSNPLKISNALTPNDIHIYLHTDKNTLDDKTFDIVKKQCKNLLKGYTQSLLDNPDDTAEHAMWFNAYINKADEIVEGIKKYGADVFEKVVPITTKANAYFEAEKYGFREVKQVTTGCGISAGYEASKSKMSSPFSVAEFENGAAKIDEDDGLGPREVKCPSCGTKSRRPKGGYIMKCPNGNNEDEKKKCKDPTAIFC